MDLYGISMELNGCWKDVNGFEWMLVEFNPHNLGYIPLELTMNYRTYGIYGIFMDFDL